MEYMLNGYADLRHSGSFTVSVGSSFQRHPTFAVMVLATPTDAALVMALHTADTIANPACYQTNDNRQPVVCTEYAAVDHL
jgi:hypothetical protein